MSSPRSWSFFRAGGFDQVALNSGAELVDLANLDQKLWVALACPTTGLELDARFLAMLDADGDGRIRAPELLSAVQFVGNALSNLDQLTHGVDSLPLASINETTDHGKQLVAAARQILRSLGKPEATAVSIADFAVPSTVFANTGFNGDGTITELSASDEATRALVRDIITCQGAEADRSGTPGTNQTKIEAFFAELTAYQAWRDLAAAASEAIYPLGEPKTEEAVSAFLAVRAKVDDYFTRCRLASFDPRLVQMLNRQETEYAELVAHDLSAAATEAAAFPLAQIAAGRALPLWGVVNPAYTTALRTLHDAAIVPLLGYRDEITHADWEELTKRLKPHLDWLAAKPVTSLEQLGTPRLLELKTATLSSLIELVDKDKATGAEAQHVDDVERLVYYHRYLFKLCTNFVNFQDFYNRKAPAIFQCGTLYIDQRACTLCLRASDPAKHATLAGLAGAYLAYIDCVRAGSEKLHVLAVITNGNGDNLMVGRNGVFYDIQGRDYDATITKIIDNPISVRQAFFAPYKKLARMIEEQVAKRATDADSASHAQLADVAAGTANADKLAAKPEPANKPIDVGVVAALGVAIAGVGTFFTAIMGYASGVIKLGLLPTVAAVAGVILLVSLPSVVLAYAKLRKRNLGPLLDACGWAINSQAKVNVPFGASLTLVAKLPPGSKRTVTDAFAEKRLPWKRYVFLFLVLYVAYKWFVGAFDGFLPVGLTPHQLFGITPTGNGQASP